MLGDGGQKVGGGEDLEVAVDLGIEPGAVDDHVGRGLQRHFLHGEGIPQDVLGQVFQVGLGLWWHLLASVDVEAAVFPGVEHLHPFGGQEFLLDQEVDDLGAEEFFQRLEGRTSNIQRPTSKPEHRFTAEWSQKSDLDKRA